MAIYGYVRVSTEEQALGQSIGIQIKQVTGAAMVRGEDIGEIFADEGVSGTTPLDARPAGARLLAALQPGDTLIVAKMDRAFRSAVDALNRAEAWKAQRVAVILLNIGTDPVNQNGAAKFFFTMMAAVAELEHTTILERTNGGRAAKKAQGGHLGGLAPIGFDVEGSGKAARLVANPEKQAALVTAREARAAGFSLRATADLVKQKHGITVSYESIRRLERAENGNAE